MSNTIDPEATGPEDSDQALDDARAEIEHYKRLLAALVKRFGPLHFVPTEYTAINPDDLRLLGMTEEDLRQGRRPTFALAEQIRPDGQLVHRLVSTSIVIASTGIDGEAAIAAARRLHDTWLLATDESPTYPDAAEPQGGSND